ncbi:hypothetical protein HJC23_011435 [Cyclotella cryptica]|uniref:Uncharacterized protein n=1 Tax=Cyclotella cryptica TaxID=29204 RepID=A0ABD3P199_9STRA
MIDNTSTERPLKRMSSCLSLQSQKSPGNDLLEDWPARDTSEVNNAKPRKHVTFSDYSSLRSYENDPKYRATKSYSSADRKRFQVDAAREGIRIQRLISSLHVQPGAAIHELIGLNLLCREELLGIEHLVSEKAALRTAHERRSHSAIVLKAQDDLRDKNSDALDSNILLAKVAISRSSRNVEKAKLRAALAADRGG